MAEDRPTAAWQTVPLVVSKFGTTDRYRMTVYLRPINSNTTAEAWPTPNFES